MSFFNKTILKEFEKAKLIDGFDIDDMMRNPDFEEEFRENDLIDVIEVNAYKKNEENEIPDVNTEKKN